MPFDDQPPPKPAKVGLKLKNDASMFANLPKKPTAQDLKQEVKQIQERSQDYKERAAQFALNYKKVLDDKTLLQNKNIFAKDLEVEAINKLVQLAMEIDADENEEHAMGTFGMISLMFRCFITQRDRINELEYALTQTNAKIKSLSEPPKTSNE